VFEDKEFQDRQVMATEKQLHGGSISDEKPLPAETVEVAEGKDVKA
jgi:hypothetical protein